MKRGKVARGIRTVMAKTTGGIKAILSVQKRPRWFKTCCKGLLVML